MVVCGHPPVSTSNAIQRKNLGAHQVLDIFFRVDVVRDVGPLIFSLAKESHKCSATRSANANPAAENNLERAMVRHVRDIRGRSVSCVTLARLSPQR